MRCFVMFVTTDCMLFLVLTVKFVNETPVCDHSSETYWAALLCGTVYYAIQGGSNF